MKFSRGVSHSSFDNSDDSEQSSFKPTNGSTNDSVANASGDHFAGASFSQKSGSPYEMVACSLAMIRYEAGGATDI